MTNPELDLAVIVSADFQENTYVVGLKGRSDCLVVDPGLEPKRIVEHLDQHGQTPAALLITHGHADHMAGNTLLKQRWPDCPIVIGHAEADKLTDAWKNLSAMFGMPITSPPADVLVRDGDRYTAAGMEFDILEIPGHSVGHVAFLWKGASPYAAFVGDVIFAGSVGRTDFPDGDFRALETGIRRKLYTLPDDTLLYSGHGPVTTVGEEKRSNPFVSEQE